jgi:hypothetical protein
MSYRVYWDRDRLKVHDESGRDADRDLPVAAVLAWLQSGGLAAATHNHDGTYAAAAHDHDAAYVAKTAAANIPAPSGGETQDAESRTAIAAILAVLEARGLMDPPSSSSSSSASP